VHYTEKLALRTAWDLRPRDKMVEHNTNHRKLADRMIRVLLTVCERDRESKEVIKNRKMLKYLEHSPVLGCRECWTEAVGGCCRCPAAPTRPSSATAGQSQQ
jgi:hypothetical protein